MGAEFIAIVACYAMSQVILLPHFVKCNTVKNVAAYIGYSPMTFTGFIWSYVSYDVEWPDRRLPRRGDPVEKCTHGKLTSCSVNFDDNPEVREIYTNDWGNYFSNRNPWNACYSDRDRSRIHDPKAKSPGMTSLHVLETLCKSVDLRRIVLWESWDCDLELQQRDFGVLHPIWWTGKRVVTHRYSGYRQVIGSVDGDVTYTDDFPCSHSIVSQREAFKLVRKGYIRKSRPMTTHDFNHIPSSLRSNSYLAEELYEYDQKYGPDGVRVTTDVADDDDCVSVCSDSSNVSCDGYQDAVEHWWKQSGRGVRYSDLHDIPPQVLNDDDSLENVEDDPEDDGSDDPPADIAMMSEDEAIKAIKDELDKRTSSGGSRAIIDPADKLSLRDDCILWNATPCEREVACSAEKPKQNKNLYLKQQKEFKGQGTVSSVDVEQTSGLVAMLATAYNIISRCLTNTGASMDLVLSTTCGCALEAGCKLNKSMATWKFSMANGSEEANKILAVFVKELNCMTYPLRTGKFPDVLSVGLRTTSKKSDRWSFGLMLGFDLFVPLPMSMIIVLVVINDVPYLIPGAPTCQPRSVADKGAQKFCGYSYINGSTNLRIDVTKRLKRKKPHVTGPAMATEADSSGYNSPGLCDVNSDDDKPLIELYDTMPSGKLYDRGQDPLAKSDGAFNALSTVNKSVDLDDSISEGVQDYGRPIMDESADEGAAEAIGQSGNEGDDKDEWLTGCEPFLKAQAKSMGHLRDHRPKNKFRTTCYRCPVRCIQHRGTKEGRRKLTGFGQCFTLDHTSVRINGVGGFPRALPVIYKHTYFRAREPYKHMNAAESERHTWYTIDKLGCRYQRNDVGKRLYNLRKKPPRYDPYIWENLGPGCHGQANYLSYKNDDSCSLESEYGLVYIPWKYAVRREVVDAETGDILDLDKQAGTRNQTFLYRLMPPERNIITKCLWHRDKYSVKRKSDEREWVWTTESAKFVMSLEDKELPYKWENVARITTYDNAGNALRGLFYPTSYISGVLFQLTDGTGSAIPKITKTRVMYFVPPEPDGKDGATTEPSVTPIGLLIVRPSVENRRTGWCVHNRSLCHTAYHAGNLVYPASIAGLLQTNRIGPAHFPVKTTYVKDLGGEWYMAENHANCTRLPKRDGNISTPWKTWSQRVTVFERPLYLAYSDLQQYGSLVGDTNLPEALAIPAYGPGSRPPGRPVDLEADAAAWVYLDQQSHWESIPKHVKRTRQVSDGNYRHCYEDARQPSFENSDACLKCMQSIEKCDEDNADTSTDSYEVVRQKRQDLAEELAALCEHPRVVLPDELLEFAHGHLPQQKSGTFPLDCMVATPVLKKMIYEDTTRKAIAAMKKERNDLRQNGVWDDLEVRDLKDFVAEARMRNEKVHFDYLHVLMVLKNSELPGLYPNRRFRCRVVFFGDRVHTQFYEEAVFDDQGSSPATIEAARCCDAHGCVPRNDVEQADAEQAYVQADMLGSETLIVLPEEGRPEGCENMHGWSTYDRPVVRVEKALYGHPDAGTFWEKRCDERVQAAGFSPVSPEWPLCHYYTKLDLYLVICVNDFRLSGPHGNLAKGWKLLRGGDEGMGLDGLLIEDPYPVGWNAETGRRNGRSLYLGCYHSIFTVKRTNSNEVEIMEYDMSAFMEKSVRVYEELVPGCGFYQSIEHADAPFLMEDHRYADSCRPCCDGNYTRCPYCNLTFGPETPVYNGNKSIGNYSIHDLSELISIVKNAKEQSGSDVEDYKHYHKLLDMLENKLTLDGLIQKWGVGAPCPHDFDEKAPDSESMGKEIHENLTDRDKELLNISYEDVPELQVQSEEKDIDEQTTKQNGSPDPHSDHDCTRCETTRTLYRLQIGTTSCTCCDNGVQRQADDDLPESQLNILRANRRRQLAMEVTVRERQSGCHATAMSSVIASDPMLDPNITNKLPPTDKAKRKRERKAVENEVDPDDAGLMTAIVPKMKVLYGARMARNYLLRAVSGFAAHFTRWTRKCDRKLHRLMCYISTNAHYRQYAWIGDDASQVEPHLYADGNPSGCTKSNRSHSGAFLCLHGPNTCFSLTVQGVRQTSVSTSTAESELVSMHHAMKKFGIPSLSLWPVLLKRRVTLHVQKDNIEAILVMETDENSTMRHTYRTRQISISWLHGVSKDQDVWMQHCLSDKTWTDIFLKTFPQKDKWQAARTLIHILDPDEVERTIDSQGDLDASDEPKLVWEKPSNDETIPPVGGTGPAMEVDHNPQVSETLVVCAVPPRANYPTRFGERLKSMQSYVQTLIEVCRDANSKSGTEFDEAQGVRHIRVTLKEDFPEMATVEWILSLIIGVDTLIWFSMPRNGGTPWTYKVEYLLPMKQYFNCRGRHPWCPGSAACVGGNTKHSEGCTEESCRMIYFCFFAYIKKVAFQNSCEPVPALRTDDYDDDYYDVSRVGRRRDVRYNQVPSYVDLKRRTLYFSFSGLRESAMDTTSFKVDLVAFPYIFCDEFTETTESSPESRAFFGRLDNNLKHSWYDYCSIPQITYSQHYWNLGASLIPFSDHSDDVMTSATHNMEYRVSHDLHSPCFICRTAYFCHSFDLFHTEFQILAQSANDSYVHVLRLKHYAGRPERRLFRTPGNTCPSVGGHHRQHRSTMSAHRICVLPDRANRGQHSWPSAPHSPTRYTTTNSITTREAPIRCTNGARITSCRGYLSKSADGALWGSRTDSNSGRTGTGNLCYIPVPGATPSSGIPISTPTHVKPQSQSPFWMMLFNGLCELQRYGILLADGQDTANLLCTHHIETFIQALFGRCNTVSKLTQIRLESEILEHTKTYHLEIFSGTSQDDWLLHESDMLRLIISPAALLHNAVMSYLPSHVRIPRPLGRAPNTQVRFPPPGICLHINSFLAPSICSSMLHSVVEGGPVTYPSFGGGSSFLNFFDTKRTIHTMTWYFSGGMTPVLQVANAIMRHVFAYIVKQTNELHLQHIGEELCNSWTTKPLGATVKNTNGISLYFVRASLIYKFSTTFTLSNCVITSMTSPHGQKLHAPGCPANCCLQQYTKHFPSVSVQRATAVTFQQKLREGGVAVAIEGGTAEGGATITYDVKLLFGPSTQGGISFTNKAQKQGLYYLLFKERLSAKCTFLYKNNPQPQISHFICLMEHGDKPFIEFRRPWGKKSWIVQFNGPYANYSNGSYVPKHVELIDEKDINDPQNLHKTMKAGTRFNLIDLQRRGQSIQWTVEGCFKKNLQPCHFTVHRGSRDIGYFRCPATQSNLSTPECEFCGWWNPTTPFPFEHCKFCDATPSYHHGRCCPRFSRSGGYKQRETQQYTTSHDARPCSNATQTPDSHEKDSKSSTDQVPQSSTQNSTHYHRSNAVTAQPADRTLVNKDTTLRRVFNKRMCKQDLRKAKQKKGDERLQYALEKARDLLGDVYEKATSLYKARVVQTQQFRNAVKYNFASRHFVVLCNPYTAKEVFCPIPRHCSGATLYNCAREVLHVQRSHSIRLWLAVPWFSLPGEQDDGVVKALSHRSFPRELLGCTLHYLFPTKACSNGPPVQPVQTTNDKPGSIVKGTTGNQATPEPIKRTTDMLDVTRHASHYGSPTSLERYSQCTAKTFRIFPTCRTYRQSRGWLTAKPAMVEYAGQGPYDENDDKAHLYIEKTNGLHSNYPSDIGQDTSELIKINDPRDGPIIQRTRVKQLDYIHKSCVGKYTMLIKYQAGSGSLGGNILCDNIGTQYSTHRFFHCWINTSCCDDEDAFYDALSSLGSSDFVLGAPSLLCCVKQWTHLIGKSADTALIGHTDHTCLTETATQCVGGASNLFVIAMYRKAQNTGGATTSKNSDVNIKNFDAYSYFNGGWNSDDCVARSAYESIVCFLASCKSILSSTGSASFDLTALSTLGEMINELPKGCLRALDEAHIMNNDLIPPTFHVLPTWFATQETRATQLIMDQCQLCDEQDPQLVRCQAGCQRRGCPFCVGECSRCGLARCFECLTHTCNPTTQRAKNITDYYSIRSTQAGMCKFMVYGLGGHFYMSSLLVNSEHHLSLGFQMDYDGCTNDKKDKRTTRQRQGQLDYKLSYLIDTGASTDLVSQLPQFMDLTHIRIDEAITSDMEHIFDRCQLCEDRDHHLVRCQAGCGRRGCHTFCVGICQFCNSARCYDCWILQQCCDSAGQGDVPSDYRSASTARHRLCIDYEGKRTTCNMWWSYIFEECLVLLNLRIDNHQVIFPNQAYSSNPIGHIMDTCDICLDEDPRLLQCQAGCGRRGCSSFSCVTVCVFCHMARCFDCWRTARCCNGDAQELTLATCHSKHAKFPVESVTTPVFLNRVSRHLLSNAFKSLGSSDRVPRLSSPTNLVMQWGQSIGKTASTASTGLAIPTYTTLTDMLSAHGASIFSLMAAQRKAKNIGGAFTNRSFGAGKNYADNKKYSVNGSFGNVNYVESNAYTSFAFSHLSYNWTRSFTRSVHTETTSATLSHAQSGKMVNELQYKYSLTMADYVVPRLIIKYGASILSILGPSGSSNCAPGLLPFSHHSGMRWHQPLGCNAGTATTGFESHTCTNQTATRMSSAIGALHSSSMKELKKVRNTGGVLIKKSFDTTQKCVACVNYNDKRNFGSDGHTVYNAYDTCNCSLVYYDLIPSFTGSVISEELQLNATLLQCSSTRLLAHAGRTTSAHKSCPECTIVHVTHGIFTPNPDPGNFAYPATLRTSLPTDLSIICGDYRPVQVTENIPGNAIKTSMVKSSRIKDIIDGEDISVTCPGIKSQRTSALSPFIALKTMDMNAIVPKVGQYDQMVAQPTLRVRAGFKMASQTSSSFLDEHTSLVTADKELLDYGLRCACTAVYAQISQVFVTHMAERLRTRGKPHKADNKLTIGHTAGNKLVFGKDKHSTTDGQWKQFERFTADYATNSKEAFVRLEPTPHITSHFIKIGYPCHVVQRGKRFSACGDVMFNYDDHFKLGGLTADNLRTRYRFLHYLAAHMTDTDKRTKVRHHAPACKLVSYTVPDSHDRSSNVANLFSTRGAIKTARRVWPVFKNWHLGAARRHADMFRDKCLLRRVFNEWLEMVGCSSMPDLISSSSESGIDILQDDSEGSDWESDASISDDAAYNQARATYPVNIAANHAYSAEYIVGDRYFKRVRTISNICLPMKRDTIGNGDSYLQHRSENYSLSFDKFISRLPLMTKTVSKWSTAFAGNVDMTTGILAQDQQKLHFIAIYHDPDSMPTFTQICSARDLEDDADQCVLTEKLGWRFVIFLDKLSLARILTTGKSIKEPLWATSEGLLKIHWLLTIGKPWKSVTGLVLHPPSQKTKPSARKVTPESTVIMTAAETTADDKQYERDRAKVAELMAEMAEDELSGAASSLEKQAPIQGGAAGHDLTAGADITTDDSETPEFIYNPSNEPHFRDCLCGRWRPHTQDRCQCGSTCYFRRNIDQPPDDQFVQSLPVDYD